MYFQNQLFELNYYITQGMVVIFIRLIYIALLIDFLFHFRVSCACFWCVVLKNPRTVSAPLMAQICGVKVYELKVLLWCLLMCLSRAVAKLWRSVCTMVLVDVLSYFYGWKKRGTAASFECWESTVSEGAGTGACAFEQWYGLAGARCCMHPYV